MTGKVNPFLLEAFQKPSENAHFRLLLPVANTSAGSIGGIEKENQDRLAVIDYLTDDKSRTFRLFALADGVGGLTAGGQCAEAAFAALTQDMITSRTRDIGARLANGFRSANQHVFSIYRGDGATTLSVLALSNTGRIVVGSVGDSRVYQYSPSSTPSILEQLTEDDTIGNQVALAKGEKQPKTSPGGILGQLTQAIGSGPDIALTITAVRHKDADEYLLTSDGFHSVGRENMLKILGSSSRPTQGIERLTHMARWLGTDCARS